MEKMGINKFTVSKEDNSLYNVISRTLKFNSNLMELADVM